jgi:hypothetical protein
VTETQIVAGSSAAPPHPEEMSATVEVRISNVVSVKATARATPAGLVAVALVLASVLIPLAWGGKRYR